MKFLMQLLLLILILVAAALALAYGGWFSVAATDPDWAVTDWFLRTARERAIERAAEPVVVPSDLEAETRLEAGFRHYDAMCEMCHGAPGKDQSAAAQGMRPAPPELYRGLGGASPKALFWVVKHGIKMTGMPAWGVTHSDAELWDIVAFLRRLPELDAATYAALEDKLGGAHHGGAGHAHGSSSEGASEAGHSHGADDHGP
jgi:mono/diheme cytochrome c family protein